MTSKKRPAEECTPSDYDTIRVVFNEGAFSVPRLELSAAILKIADEHTADGKKQEISLDTITEAVMRLKRLDLEAAYKRKTTESSDDTCVVMAGKYPDMCFVRIPKDRLGGDRITVENGKHTPMEDVKTYFFDGAEFYHELMKGAVMRDPFNESTYKEMNEEVRELALTATVDMLSALRNIHNVTFTHHTMLRNDPKTTASELLSMMPHYMTCPTHKLTRMQMHDEISKLRDKASPGPKVIVSVAEDAMNAVYNNGVELVDDVMKRLVANERIDAEKKLRTRVMESLRRFKKYAEAVHADVDDYLSICASISETFGLFGAFPEREKDAFDLSLKKPSERLTRIAYLLDSSHVYESRTRDDLLEDLTASETEKAECKASLKLHKEAASRLSDENQSFERKLSKSEKRITALEKELKEAQALARERAKEIRRLEAAALAEATNREDPKPQSKTQSKTQPQSKTRETEELKDALKAARDAREASVEENRLLKTKLDNTQKHLSDLATRYATLSAENEYRKARADATKATAETYPEQQTQQAHQEREEEDTPHPPEPSKERKDECPICLSEHITVMLEECCHSFCEECMGIEWRGVTCPVCAQWLTSAYLTVEPYTMWNFNADEKRWSSN